MSLVGTRPPTVDEWEQYELHHRSRMSTKPGITGMWQVTGRSDITDFEEVVRLDSYALNQYGWLTKTYWNDKTQVLEDVYFVAHNQFLEILVNGGIGWYQLKNTVISMG